MRPPLAATRIRGRTAEPRASWLHWASRLAACTHQQAISDTRRAIISRVWKASQAAGSLREEAQQHAYPAITTLHHTASSVQ